MQIPFVFSAGKFDFSNAGAPEEMQHLLADTESIPWRRRKYEQVRRSRENFPNDQDLVCPAYSCSYGQLTPPPHAFVCALVAMPWLPVRTRNARKRSLLSFLSLRSDCSPRTYPSGSDFCGTGEARQGAGGGGQRRRLVSGVAAACVISNESMNEWMNAYPSVSRANTRQVPAVSARAVRVNRESAKDLLKKKVD